MILSKILRAIRRRRSLVFYCPSTESVRRYEQANRNRQAIARHYRKKAEELFK